MCIRDSNISTKGSDMMGQFEQLDQMLTMDPEYADAYKDMTFEEVVAYLGQDPNELP